MFVQVIQAQVSDPTEFARRLRLWEQELLPGAVGALGSTAGVTDDGTAFMLARFEDEDKARANAARAEQDAWWAATEPLFTHGAEFRESSDISLMGPGGSDNAGFVQIMQGRIKDKQKYLARMDASVPEMEQLRPDVIGGITVWFGDEYVEAVYFTSEAEARAGEAAMAGVEMPPEMAEFMDLIDGETAYFDLREPILISPR